MITVITNEYFVVGYRFMVVITMEILETAGGIVADSRDSWWSSIIVETAGGIIVIGRDRQDLTQGQ